MSTASTNDVMVYQMGGDGLWHWRLMPWDSVAAGMSVASDATPQLTPASSFATAAQGAKADSALQNAAAFDASGAAASAQSAAISAAATDATTKANAAQAFAIQRSNQTGTQSADTLTSGSTNKVYTATEQTKLSGIAAGATAIVADTGYTPNSTAGDKTAVLASYTNGLNGTMVTALNVVSAGTGTALSAALDTIALLVKKTAALETTLVAGKLPNA